MNKILLVYGGDSVEHEISIISALQAYLNYDSDKYELELVYLSKNKNFYVGEALKNIENYKNIDKLLLNCTKIDFFKDKQGNYYRSFIKKNYFDYVWLVVHGCNCEDGTLYNYFKIKDIMCIGLDQYQGSISQDKFICKQYLKAFKIKQIPFLNVYCNEYENNSDQIINKIKELGFPVIIKPSRLGSSIGIKIAYNELEFIDGMEETFLYDRNIIVEKYIENMREFNISILGDRNHYNLSLIEEVSNNSYLSYDDKYKSNNNSKGMAGLNRIIPANINEKLKNKIHTMALKVANALNTSLLVRLDFIYNEEKDELYFNEINNIPGSLAYYLWEPININFSKLIDMIISLGIQNEYLKKSLLNHYNENILSENSLSGIKIKK